VCATTRSSDAYRSPLLLHDTDSLRLGDAGRLAANPLTTTTTTDIVAATTSHKPWNTLHS
jgi:hypothetical protein